MWKTLSKLLGVMALAVAAGVGGHGVASAANPPSDGGDSSCAPDKSNCFLYHFKLNGTPHTMEFTTYTDPCKSAVKARYTVERKNSANVWLDPNAAKYVRITFDGGDHVEGMTTVSCGSGNPTTEAIVNNENKCWEFETLVTRGAQCNWQ